MQHVAQPHQSMQHVAQPHQSMQHVAQPHQSMQHVACNNVDPWMATLRKGNVERNF